MTATHDPMPAKTKLQRAPRYSHRNHPGRVLHRKMNSDELPIYPTPQQATYTMPPRANPSARGPGKPYQPSSAAPPAPSGHTNYGNHSGQANGVPPQEYSQHPRPYQPAPTQQYYQPQHVPAPVTLQYLHQSSHQSGGYGSLPPQQQPHRVQQGTQQYYLNGAPPLQIPPQPRNVSASSSHYGSAPLTTSFHQGALYQPPQQQQAQHTQPGQRAASYSGQQYVHPSAAQTLSPPAGHSPTTPQMSGRTHAPPSKKPPLGLASRSRDNLDEVPKQSSKQRLEAELRATFDRVDTNHLGKISARELSAALINFDNTGFQHTTVRLMIKLFSGPASASLSGLNFEQFVSLWKYLTAYKKLFVAADVNKSGDISFGEFQRIIEQIGYKLNVDLVLHLFQKFANKESHDDGSVAVGKLKFDAFIELLVYLRKLTDIFKQYDKQLTGVATIDYLDFLFEISNLT